MHINVFVFYLVVIVLLLQHLKNEMFYFWCYGLAHAQTHAQTQIHTRESFLFQKPFHKTLPTVEQSLPLTSCNSFRRKLELLQGLLLGLVGQLMKVHSLSHHHCAQGLVPQLRHGSKTARGSKTPRENNLMSACTCTQACIHTYLTYPYTRIHTCTYMCICTYLPTTFIHAFHKSMHAYIHARVRSYIQPRI